MRDVKKSARFVHMADPSSNITPSPIITVVTPTGAHTESLGELWHGHQLIFYLVWRDLIVRYKQAVFGVAWAVLNPLLTMAIFTVVFRMVAGLNSSGTPYPLFVLVAMLPYQLWANALQKGGNSLVSNSHLIAKVYFPRIIVPIAAVIVSVVDLIINFILLAFLMLWYRIAPGPEVLLLIPFLVLNLMLCFGASFFLSAVNLRYADFRQIVPFIVQIGLYLSPVGYATSTVPEKWKPILTLNPLVGLIDGYRYALLGVEKPTTLALLFLVFWALLLFFGGIRYFRGREVGFADLV